MSNYFLITQKEESILNEKAIKEGSKLYAVGILPDSTKVICQILPEMLSNKKDGFLIGFIINKEGAWKDSCIFKMQDVSWEKIDSHK